MKKAESFHTRNTRIHTLIDVIETCILEPKSEIDELISDSEPASKSIWTKQELTVLKRKLFRLATDL